MCKVTFPRVAGGSADVRIRLVGDGLFVRPYHIPMQCVDPDKSNTTRDQPARPVIHEQQEQK